ncbi:DUF221-domain-containing protein [Aspergillus novofumigatus IBT 16806]|uniref:DUF221-domain-containing protein n=1 Tax=Aspergillus novofumigatus (strain IBT 16806) TaxID=1392255 RepID=A0A2I1BS07_ASPN1|nr:DUF221-domain-containing protein [Aspergillus novofumigatus IBT 16806]PKX88197.1 DUF221-domain-containing protein [Aspergillus novofumigatus IBT 16806]
MATDLGLALEHAGGNGQRNEGVTIQTFLASLATAVIVFAVEFLLFLLLKGKLTRIYQPRTYLVPDRERTKPSPPGLFSWIGPVFRTSSSEFIQKCGLDAYFFLRYLRMLLKIFVPLGCIVLPVLLPLNKVDGKDRNFKNATGTGDTWNVTGLDQLAWGNVAPEHVQRYWAHLIMAVIVIVYVCAIFFDELKGYIRLRQAYLTSPQHRLRASATTVLVTAIPDSWLSVEALESLYDFPRVKQRDALALKLESAETDLIIKCKKAQLKQAKAAAKKSGLRPKEHALQLAAGGGISSGDPHQAHTLNQILHRDVHGKHRADSGEPKKRKPFDPAVEAVGMVGQSVGNLGRSVLGTLKRVEGDIDGNAGTTAPLQHRASNAETNSAELPDPWRPSNDSITPSIGNGNAASINENGAPSDAPRSRSNSKPRRPFWKSRMSSNYSKASNRTEPDEFPLTAPEDPAEGEASNEERSHNDEKQKGKKHKGRGSEDYGEPLWKKYIREKDRDTMRLPIFGLSWMPSLWLIGKKVDTIDYCRKEIARLNLEIEIDQQHPEKFPLMNSAFIQFNHQVAAHMACQAVSHHLPKQMAPRTVEISPDDVIWDNMSIKWWERYLRTFGILTIVCAMVVGWAFPVAFTGLLSQLSYLENAFTWLSWISKLPDWLISAIQGILPPLFLAILMALLPLILRFLCRAQGLHTGMAIELTVQNYFFAFLFVQLFLVVAISSSFSTIIDNVTNVTSWPELLAQNIPSSSNYFFSYMILQALSVSAGALVQIVGLFSWFILAPLLDNTARKKWGRTTNLNQMQWGTFFPVYTTLASIGLIYCVISPLILVFNIITFGLFWFVYRYNTLYVTKFRFDTGGLLFPRAINQLFTGLYVMELSLIGLFFLVRDVDGNVACEGQAICMIVVLILTIGYQILLNEAFSPLIRYLPITLEDDAAHEIELKNIEANSGRRASTQTGTLHNSRHHSWADRSSKTRSKYFGTHSSGSVPTLQRVREKITHDAEAQGPPTGKIGHALFAGIHDELEDLTPDERDQLTQRAFQHDALRAKRPVIWIPRDDLGVSDDEIYRTQRFSKHIWISNEYQALDGKCRTIFSRSPPDFSEIDLIQL